MAETIDVSIVGKEKVIGVNFDAKFRGSHAVQARITGPSPITVKHDIGKFPSVAVLMVIDGHLVEVEACVEHIDDRNVLVSWNGDYRDGYIYII